MKSLGNVYEYTLVAGVNMIPVDLKQVSVTSPLAGEDVASTGLNSGTRTFVVHHFAPVQINMSNFEYLGSDSVCADSVN